MEIAGCGSVYRSGHLRNADPQYPAGSSRRLPARLRLISRGAGPHQFNGSFVSYAVSQNNRDLGVCRIYKVQALVFLGDMLGVATVDWTRKYPLRLIPPAWKRFRVRGYTAYYRRAFILLDLGNPFSHQVFLSPAGRRLSGSVR